MLNNTLLVENNIKKNIRTNFGKNAHNYSKHGTVQKELAQILFKETSKQIDISSIATLLEIGCGTGFLSKHLVHNFKNTQHFISDLSIEMIEECRRNTFFTNSKYLVCDGELLSFAEDTNFDLIIANMSFHWFQEFSKTIQNLFKITNTLAFSIPIHGTFQAWNQAHEDLGIKNRMIPLYSISNLKKILLSNKPKKLSMKTIDLSTPVKSSIGFLQYLKLMGASTSTANFYTIPELRSLCKRVDSLFIDDIANYKIAICILQK